MGRLKRSFAGYRNSKLLDVAHQNRRSKRWDTKRCFFVQNQCGKKPLAIPAGFEPATQEVEIRHSRQPWCLEAFCGALCYFFGCFSSL
jgi:hypothetical protein